MIRDVVQRKPSLSAAQRDGASTRFGPIVSGIVASVVNPYWVTWWLTIGATYVLLALKRGPIGLPLFYTGHILSNFLWLSSVSLALSQGRRLIGERFYRGLIFTCGLFLSHIIMPAVALSAIPMAMIARVTRSSMPEVLGQDYIRTAWAKGQLQFMGS